MEVRMKIGVLGSGIVGKTLATGFLQHGHEVTLGSRTPEKLSEWAENHSSGKTGTFAEAAAFGEVVVLAVKGAGASEAAREAGAGNLKGKPVMDTCNPIAEAPPVNGVLQFFTGPNESLMEKLQQEFPAAHFVKAYSCVGSGLMVDPKLPGGKPSMFICGNDDVAKSTVTRIVLDFGWEVEDMGKVEAARAIEPLCLLWCLPWFTKNDWVHAFKVLR
ncbi:DNA-binding protein [Acidobacteria bacterium AB60]|nr:DNA-binding protein [Acidobacteria bacterium AB60]